MSSSRTARPACFWLMKTTAGSPDRRYFIVIDDLWTASVWNIISHAFPHGDCRSRIITTTQIDDVALACCSYDSHYTYKMEPLNHQESRNIFFSIVFGTEDGCPVDIKEVSNEIIRKCGGLPLAIVNIASLLASESSVVWEKWKHLEDSLPSTSEGTKDGLSLIYNSLPHLLYNSLPPRLRTCLLYLSMYPHGYVIKKDDLVKHWVAEDFLSGVGGRDTEEIGEGYFDELVSRGMVQAVEINNNGEVLSCTVHQMVLDFIRSKSMEENFIINVDYFQKIIVLPDKVRRLSVHFGGVKGAYIPESIITSHVRSLIFWGFFKCLPSVTDYGLLRVLVLHIWADQDNTSFDLTRIGELFRLNYLKIECNITVELPGNVQNLQHLGTLHIDARLSAVPSGIVNLGRLLHLRLPSESIMPKEVAQMTSLRTLGYFDLNSDLEQNVLLLGQLTNLQDLQLTCSAVEPPAENLEKNVQLLGSILHKLSALQSVTLVPASGFSCTASLIIPCDGFNMVSPPSELVLRRIEMSRRCCVFFSLPKWFGELRNLCTLKMAIKQLWKEDVDILKRLTSLIALTLYIQTVPAERISIGEGGFQVLTYFKFMCAAPCLSFVQGAMPKVQNLNLGFNSDKMKAQSLHLAGVCHLTGLIDICVKFGVRDGEEFDIKAAESALEAAVSNHPKTPIIRVQRVDVIFDGEEDQSTATEIKEENRQEIQEEKIEITGGGSGGHSRYARADRVSIPLTRHPQSVDLLTGAIGPLLPKLLELLKENNLEAKVKDSMESLYRELDGMQATLREREAAHLDYTTTVWAKLVRNFSYDVEDVIDFLLVGSRGGTKQGRISCVAKFRTRGKARHETAEAINSIMNQRQELIELRTRYNVDASMIADNPAATSFKPHLTNVYTYPKELVGIKVSTDEVIRMLIDETNDELKIVSIVGTPGLGKTTLAKIVYEKIQRQFDCWAFVSVSPDPDMEKVCMDILHQVDKQKYSSLNGATLTVNKLTKLIQEILANKRYLIIIDDICEVSSWGKIKDALVDSKHGSRVITTTGVFNLAKTMGGVVYELKELSFLDREALFNKILFSGKEVPGGLPEEHKKLLSKCGGVPLAIITMASLLARKPMNDWPMVYYDIAFGDKDNADAMYLTKILSLSYYHLPYHLRACFLHLHIFPRGYLIRKETLIWKWAAEGFIVEEPGTGLFEVGEGYFKELVNRNLVIAAEDDSHCGIVIGCHVHGFILDVICAISANENFVTSLDYSSRRPTFGSKQLARRLAVQKRAAEQGDPLDSSRPELRSFNTMGCHFSTKLSLSRFRHLRVIAIEECTFIGGERLNLKYLGRLLQLRYLGLYNTRIDKLPEEIGDLLSLQTLDLRGTTLKELPCSVSQLRQLKCLRADEGTAVTDVRMMENLTSLQELRLGQVGNKQSANFIVNELGKLKELRELELWITQELDESKKKALVHSMRNLRKIQVLRLMGVVLSSSGDEDNSWEGYEPPLQLRELHLTHAFPRLPAWVNVSCVPMLSYLHVNVKDVEEQDLENLGSLPELVSLKLRMPRTSSNVTFPTIKGGRRAAALFPRLRYFGTSTPVRFLPEAMPCLEFFHFEVHAQSPTVADFDYGTLGNLPCLQKVEVEISSSGGPARHVEVEAVHEEVKRAVDKHVNTPNLHVINIDQVEIPISPAAAPSRQL